MNYKIIKDKSMMFKSNYINMITGIITLKIIYSEVRNHAQCLDIIFFGQRFMTYQVRYMVGSLI